MTFQSGLGFQTGLSSLRVSCKRALKLSVLTFYFKDIVASLLLYNALFGVATFGFLTVGLSPSKKNDLFASMGAL